MASAEVSKTAVTVTLHMSEEEARLVYFVLDHVSGSPGRSQRKHAEGVQLALEPLLSPQSGYAEWYCVLRAQRNSSGGIGFHEAA